MLVFVSILFFPQHYTSANSSQKTSQVKKIKLTMHGIPNTTISYNKKWPDTLLRGLNTKVYILNKKTRPHAELYLSDKDFLNFIEWSVNVIRVPINVDWDSIWNIKKGEKLPEIPKDDPLSPYRKHLHGLENTLILAKKYNINVIVTLGNVAGRRIDVLYNEDDGSGYYKELPKLWDYIALKFGKNPNLLAYDILNEPVEKKGKHSWREIILPDLIKKIRLIDKDTYLVIEASWGGAKALKKFKPVSDKRSIYSFHFYAPHNFTHQGIRGIPRGYKYPGRIKRYNNSPEIEWDQARLESKLQDAVEFQRKYDTRILVGEFGAVRWASGAQNYLRDSILLFEKFGWDWCFHSYGGWNGFNPTFYSDDPQYNAYNGGRETRRLEILKMSWGKNEIE